MKIPFPCTECIHEAVKAGRPPLLETVRLSPSESGCYEVRCMNGHTTPHFLQQMRFEVLFEIGAHAIVDGYYREAISSFTSALERFLELYVRVICRRNELATELVDSIWKTVNSQSERQLGAYLFLYGVTERGKPPYLPQKMTELRNNVIHKGRLPSQAEAVTYGNAVLEIINPTLRLLKTRDMAVLLELVREHMADAQKSYPTPITSTMCLNTIVSISRDVSMPDLKDLASWSPPRYY